MINKIDNQKAVDWMDWMKNHIKSEYYSLIQADVETFERCMERLYSYT